MVCLEVPPIGLPLHAVTEEGEKAEKKDKKEKEKKDSSKVGLLVATPIICHTNMLGMHAACLPDIACFAGAQGRHW
jgi:hypothetical protein